MQSLEDIVDIRSFIKISASFSISSKILLISQTSYLLKENSFISRR